MINCKYYQAQIKPKDCWFVVAILRSYEHLVFDRTYSKETSIFEFFVPEYNESTFLEVMKCFTESNLVLNLQKKII